MTDASAHLTALRSVHALCEEAGLEYWLFGGWAVDFHAGRVTRAHDDLDIAVWLRDLPRIAALLEQVGWSHAPDPEEDGGTGYERGGVRLELTFLVGKDDGTVVVPLREHEAPWPVDAFPGDDRTLLGVEARLVGLGALRTQKSGARDDAADAEKDAADLRVLSSL